MWIFSPIILSLTCFDYFISWNTSIYDYSNYDITDTSEIFSIWYLDAQNSTSFTNYIILNTTNAHPITGYNDDSAYVTTKTADRNQRSTEDG